MHYIICGFSGVGKSTAEQRQKMLLILKAVVILTLGKLIRKMINSLKIILMRWLNI